MEIDEGFLEVNDLDWFGVLKEGIFAHFATSGKGVVPGVVRKSFLNYETAFDYFFSLEKTEEFIVVEENLPEFSSNTMKERYLSSFVDMAKRGLFSYDANQHRGYKLIAKPVIPFLKVSSDVISIIPKLTISSEEEIVSLDEILTGHL